MADSENFPYEPEIIGSENKIYWQKDIDAAVKQARAEVMAACIKALCPHCAAGAIPTEHGIHGVLRGKNSLEQANCAAYPLRQLQPAAAKSLEELLEEARRDGQLKEAQRWFRMHEHIAELEKARASEGKG